MASAAAPGAFTQRKHDGEDEGKDPHFPVVVGAHSLVILILMGLILRVPDEPDSAKDIANNNVGRFYMFYSHVCIMIVVGFGYLMTFLKRYNYSAVSYNFMLAAFVFLWNQVAATFWHQINEGNGLHGSSLTMESLIEGMFGAGAVLISFGAVLGKTTPSQLLVIAFWEVIFYSLNLYLGLQFQVADAGGSMIIHAFGAYFGLGLALVMSPKGAGKTDHPYNGASYTSDMHSMIGTVFLWIFWPSFNAALQPDGLQLRAIVNTTLSLSGSVLATFLASYALVHSRVSWASERKFDMVHIQNATLAGGVAMGAASNMRVAPFVAVIIGIVAGLLSTWGYHACSEKLRGSFNIDDTCGVNNLHGMPGILGAVISALVLLVADESSYGYTWSSIVADGRTGAGQAGFQIATLVVTLIIAFTTGALTGKIALLLPSLTWPVDAFSDHSMWEVPDDYISTGQASRGERAVTPRTAARNHCAAAFPDLELAPAAPADDDGAGAGAGAGTAAAVPEDAVGIEMSETNTAATATADAPGADATATAATEELTTPNPMTAAAE